MAWVRKTCWRCKAEKPVTDFNRDASRWDGLRATCRDCASVESADYRRRNSERVLTRERAFTAAHPDRTRSKSLKFYQTHSERERARAATYRKAHLDVYRSSEAKRRARQRMTQVGRVDYARIRQRDGMLCHICGEHVLESEIQFDHIIPLSKGGPHTEANIAVSHGWCNRSKSARLMSEIRA